MFSLPLVDDTITTGAVLPTFDALLVGPAEDDAGNSTPAHAYVWRTRAWLPPTKHQRG